ncbi:MAG TPA: hypothetical protein PKL78_07625 [Anaerolineales bacterium]|nr:hypothetical protein [Anaerolineales bacterium]
MNVKKMLGLLVSLFVLSACAPAAGTQPVIFTVPPPATERPGSSAPAATLPANEAPESPDYYPLSTRTGIADVDAVLAAVESGNAQTLRDLVRFTTVGCTNAEGMGGPPKCGEGEAEGTLVTGLPLIGPEGSFMRESDLANLTFMEALGIYAVYSVSDSAYSEEAYPAGEYTVMFVTGVDQIYVAYQVRAGIVRMDTLFSTSSRDTVIQRDASELILAPK